MAVDGGCFDNLDVGVDRCKDSCSQNRPLGERKEKECHATIASTNTGSTRTPERITCDADSIYILMVVGNTTNTL